MIKYKSGYKYQIAETYRVQTSVFPDHNVKTEYLSLSMSGMLTVWKGYCYDGPSGITYDSKNSMRGALIHDALYQILREKHLDHHWRKQVDME